MEFLKLFCLIGLLGLIVFVVYVVLCWKKRVKNIKHARAKEHADINVRLAQNFLEDLLQKFHVANPDN